MASPTAPVAPTMATLYSFIGTIPPVSFYDAFRL